MYQLDKWIVNADDFGISSDVNKAIVACFESKFINQTTLMVNMPLTKEAVTLAKKNYFDNSVGLHLNLIEGTPLTERIRHTILCNDNGQFSGELMKGIRNRLIFNRNLEAVVYAEIEAQITKYLDYGFTLMHIDSHQHSHTNLNVLKVLLSLAKQYRFVSIRLARNIPTTQIKGINKVYKHYVNSKILRFNNNNANNFTVTNFGSMQDVTMEMKTNILVNLELMIHPVIKNNNLLDAFSDKSIADWWSENNENHFL